MLNPGLFIVTKTCSKLPLCFDHKLLPSECKPYIHFLRQCKDSVGEFGASVACMLEISII